MAYVIVKQVSYSLQDPVRKGGSDDGEEKYIQNRSGGLVEYGGFLYFFY